MRALVTGCAGFIGSHLTERLLADGWAVTGIDALTDYYDIAEKVSNLAGFRDHPRFDLITEDLVTTDLQSAMAGVDVVFHLAAQPGVRGSFGSGFDVYVHDNVTATQRVFEAALESRVSRVVYASSSSVYGDATAYPVIENVTGIAPRSPYGVTKATCEHLATVYRGLGLDSVGLRYFTVYGPRQRPDMAMRRLCEAAAGGPRFTLHGDGLQSRDFTHVSDVVTATVLAGQAEDVDPVLNIGGGHEATMREVIAILRSHGGQLNILRGPDQRGDVRRTGADTTLARTQLNWQPAVDLVDGLRTELDWVRDRAAARVTLGELAEAVR
jgi:UDP-glucuronate 4-epimerase